MNNKQRQFLISEINAIRNGKSEEIIQKFQSGVLSLNNVIAMIKNGEVKPVIDCRDLAISKIGLSLFISDDVMTKCVRRGHAKIVGGSFFMDVNGYCSAIKDGYNMESSNEKFTFGNFHCNRLRKLTDALGIKHAPTAWADDKKTVDRIDKLNGEHAKVVRNIMLGGEEGLLDIITKFEEKTF